MLSLEASVRGEGETQKRPTVSEKEDGSQERANAAEELTRRGRVGSTRPESSFVSARDKGW